MDNKPLVSICCMTYNHEKYINQTLKSFQDQVTNFNFEIIIHDDNSTDNTKNIIETYSERDNRVKPIFQKENKYSKNERIWYKYMFPVCKGKYIAICDGDDYWTDPLKLQKQVDFLEKNTDYGIVGTRMLSYYVNNKEFIDWEHQKNKKERLDIVDLIEGNFIFASSVLIKNDFEIKNWWYELPFGDWPLYINQIKNRKIKILDENTGVYRVHDLGIFSGLTKIQQLQKDILCVTTILIHSDLSDIIKQKLQTLINLKTEETYSQLLTDSRKNIEELEVQISKSESIILNKENIILNKEKTIISQKRKITQIKKSIIYKTLVKLELFVRCIKK